MTKVLANSSPKVTWSGGRRRRNPRPIEASEEVREQRMQKLAELKAARGE
jgi:hypothetical protein